MSSKILVADDSLTIQKVIGITLANTNYELTECTKEEDLVKKINSEKYDLVLLDFNLSETKSGYELSLEIKQALPKAGVIVMLGTFDSVDESKFAEYGINDKIIKPFESSKFIKKCKDVLENVVEFQAPIKTASPKVEEVVEENNLDSWVVDGPKQDVVAASFDTEEEFESEAQEETLDPLKSEIKGWGFEVENNLEEKFGKEFPPIIDEKESSFVLERLQSSSTFVEETSSFDDDQTDPSFEVPQDLNRNLLEEIDEEVSAEAFWAVDEVVPFKSEESEDIQDTRLDEVTADLTETVNAFKESQKTEELYSEPVAHSESISTNVNVDELVQKLKVALAPQIEALVKEYCKEIALKVSWEVIPDLAENLIKKEIKELSDSVH